MYCREDVIDMAFSDFGGWSVVVMAVVSNDCTQISETMAEVGPPIAALFVGRNLHCT